MKPETRLLLLLLAWHCACFAAALAVGLFVADYTSSPVLAGGAFVATLLLWPRLDRLR